MTTEIKRGRETNKMMEEFRKQIQTLDYPNGDRLELHVEYMWDMDKWEAHLVSIQRRGLARFIGVVGEYHYATTPTDAAAKAVKHAPKNWAHEPNMIALVWDGNKAWYEPIPISRAA